MNKTNNNSDHTIRCAKSVKQSAKSRWMALAIAGAVLTGTAGAGGAAVEASAAAVQTPLQFKTLPITAAGRTLAVPGGVTSEGETYVGLAFLSKELGLTAGWDAKTKVISVKSNNKTMEMKADSYNFVMNGHSFSGNSPVIVWKGTTYLPLRFLLEQMGYSIGYEAATKRITITPIAENNLKLTSKTIEVKLGKATASIQYPQLEGWSDPEAQQKINAALENEAKSYAGHAKDVYDESADAYGADSGADGASSSVDESDRFDYDVNYAVTSNEQGIFSMYFNTYVYTGGAHGLYDFSGHTFDLKTGKELTLQDATLGNPDYIKIINAEVSRQFTAKQIDTIFPFETIEPDQRFFMRGGNIVIYFSLYEYTPYAFGIPEFTIPVKLFAQNAQNDTTGTTSTSGTSGTSGSNQQTDSAS